MNWATKWSLIVAAAAVLVSGGAIYGADIVLEGTDEPARREVLDAMQGKPAPALQVENWVNADDATLEAWKGKVVMLDFWGVWCGPCRALVPHLKEMHAKYSEQGLVIVGVHTTRSGDEAAAFVAEESIPYPVAVDIDKKTTTTYHVDSYPDIYLIDHEGNLRFADLSNGTDGNIEAAVEMLLKERADAMKAEAAGESEA